MRRSFLSAVTAFLAVLGVGRGAAAAPARVSSLAGAAEAAGSADPAQAAFPFPLVTVAGSEALAARRRLLAEGRGWPVIVGDDEALARLAESMTFESRPAADILKAADGLRMPQALAARKAAESEALRKLHPEIEDDEGPDEGAWPSTGDAPQPAGDIPMTPLAATNYATGGYLPRVHILLAPTDEGAAVLAHLRYGGWNDCPPPEYHVAQLRALHERYGFELIAVGPDTIEGQFQRLPASRAEAMALARELHLYCSDSIYQGFDTVSAYAHDLLTSRWRFFWWD